MCICNVYIVCILWISCQLVLAKEGTEKGSEEMGFRNKCSLSFDKYFLPFSFSCQGWQGTNEGLGTGVGVTRTTLYFAIILPLSH